MNQIDLSRTSSAPRAHRAQNLFQPRAVALAAAALCGLHSLTWAQNVPSTTLPTGGVVARGAATISTNGSNATPVMNINQTSSRAVINWGTFSVGSNATVAHQTPGANAITLHRVVGEGNGPSRSFINGSITSNGKVFLVNNAGVVFGGTARVNVGALVASSRDLDPSLQANNFEGFVNGQQLTFNVGSNVQNSHEVVRANNGARITAGPNGSILLIAGNETSVLRSALAANGGNVGLVAATDTTVDVGQSGFVRLVSASTGSSNSGTSTPARMVIVTNGQIDAANGNVQMLARGTNSEVPGVTVSTSTVRANGQGGGRGSVELVASGGISSFAQVTDSTIDASALDAASTAGSVNMLARSVTVRSREASGNPYSRILADGPAGGGSITLGDLCADPCTTERASSVLVSQFTTLSADATANGNGGRITLSSTFNNAVADPVAFADFGVVALYGTLRARGGTEGGNGGQILTVGPSLTTSVRSGVLEAPTRFAGINASARAAGQAAGTWIVRSGDVELSSPWSSPVEGNTGEFSPTVRGAQGITRTVNGSLSNGTHVTVNTDFAPNGSARIGTGNITVTSDAAIAGSANTTLRLEAANNITVQAGSTISRTPSAAGAFNVVMLGDVDGRNGSVGQPGGVVQGAVNVSLPGGSFTASGHSVAGQSPVDGVNLTGTISADNITLTGSSQQRYGVNVGGLNLRPTEGVAGNVVVRGTALRSNSSVPSSVQLAGVNFEEGIDLLAGLASVTIAGRGDDGGFSADAGVGAVGVRLNDLAINGDAASSARFTLVGQSVNSTAPGILAVGAGNSLEMRSNLDSNAALGANIVIGASSDAQSARSLDFSRSLRPRIITTGGVNLRPLGVDAAGNVVEATNTAIHIGNNAPAGTNFVLDSRLLNNATATEGGIRATQGVVIGSNHHTGRITVGDMGLVAVTDAGNGSGFDSPVTLQNQGGGSEGIRLVGNMGGRNIQLGLMSAGDIIQENGRGLLARSVAVVGSPTSVVSLNSQNNEISSLSFDGPRTIDVRSSASLTVTGGSVNSFSLADGFAQQRLNASRAGQRVSLTGNLDLRVVDTSLSFSEANATLSLFAFNRSLSLLRSDIEAGAGPLDVSISASVGKVTLTSDERMSTIRTNGGSVSITSSGSTLATGPSVQVDRSVIDTRGASGAGDISISGAGRNRSQDGVLLTNTVLTGRNITVNVSTSRGQGLGIAQTNMTASGNVRLSGSSIAGGTSMGGSGVRIGDNSQINLSNTSELQVTGIGTLNGTVLDDLMVLGGSRIVLAGQHPSSGFNGGAGLRNSAGTPGLRIGGRADGSGSAATVLMAASSGDTSPAIDMDGGLRIQTTGRVNIRPASVSGTGNVLDSLATTIGVGGNSPSSNFAVPASWLNPVTGIDAAQVVIGSQQHTGAITVAAGALATTGSLPVTLQNQGVGSGGIAFEGAAGSSSLNLGLSTAGNVSQVGALTAVRLVVQGGSQSTVNLNATGNRVASVSFDPPAAMSLVTSGNLSVNSGQAQGFDATTSTFTRTAITTNEAGQTLLLRSVDGDLALNSSIRMLGNNASVDLVAGNLFATLPTSRINFGEGGGAWRVWMNSATGNTTEGLVGSNLYGCSFGDTATCSGSGAVISSTSNLFLYTQRPTLQITPHPQTIQQGAALPVLTYTVASLVNGDAQAHALAGALDTAATNSNTAGSFAIRQGTLNSPSGYQINYNNGNQTPVNLVIQAPPRLFEDLSFSLLEDDKLLTKRRSNVYGFNAPARPNVRAEASTIRSAKGQDLSLEPLTAEWLRVRGQSYLSGCLQGNNEKAYSAF